MYGQQPPPAGFYNGAYPAYPAQPYVYLPAMTYEQQMAYRQQMLVQQREFINRRLKENFPTKYVLLHSVSLILIGLAAIGLQIALIVLRSTNYYVGQGIWAGLVCILLAGLSLLLIKKRTYGYFIASIICTSFGLMVIFGGLIIANIIGINSFSCSFSSNRCDNSYTGLNIAMIVLGVLAFILCIAYFIALPISIQACVNRSRYSTSYNQQVGYNNNGAAFHPQNLSAPIAQPANPTVYSSTNPYNSQPF